MEIADESFCLNLLHYWKLLLQFLIISIITSNSIAVLWRKSFFFSPLTLGKGRSKRSVDNGNGLDVAELQGTSTTLVSTLNNLEVTTKGLESTTAANNTESSNETEAVVLEQQTPSMVTVKANQTSATLFDLEPNTEYSVEVSLPPIVIFLDVPSLEERILIVVSLFWQQLFDLLKKKLLLV